MGKKKTTFTVWVLILAGCSATSSPEDAWRYARDAVSASLRDPESARFGTFTRGKGKSVCGSVNSKNGFGGYTGMEPFAYTPGAAQPVLLYEFHGPLGGWEERGELAESFASRGCSIGQDQDQALEAVRLIRESDRQILGK